MGISYGNNNFWSALTYAYATLREIVAEIIRNFGVLFFAI